MDPFEFNTPETVKDTKGLRDQWGEFINDPRATSAILQMGLSLMQPLSPGQSSMGAVGQAIGGVGEMFSRQEAIDMARAKEDREGQKMDMAVGEAESRQDLRGAQADVATSRAAVAGTAANAATERANLARDRLQFDREKEEGRQRIRSTSNLIKLQNAYSSQMKAVDAQNTSRKLLGQPELPKVDFNTWLSSNPKLVETILGTSTPGVEPQGRGSFAAPGTQGTQGMDDGVPMTDADGKPIRPEAPRDPKARTSGMIYTTPRGPLRWTGSVWETP